MNNSKKVSIEMRFLNEVRVHVADGIHVTKNKETITACYCAPNEKSFYEPMTRRKGNVKAQEEEARDRLTERVVQYYKENPAIYLAIKKMSN